MTRTRRSRLVLAALAAALLLSATALAGCGGVGSRDLPPPSEMPDETVRVSVFFSTGRSLLEERRVVDATDVYSSTLDALLAGDAETPDVAIVQPRAAYRSVTLADGVITIDWDREILDFDADPEEYRLAWAAFIMTFGQFPEVEQVAFTVEGMDAGEIDGRDIAEFWGEVTFANQPWDVQRPPEYDDTEEIGGDPDAPGVVDDAIGDAESDEVGE